MFYKQRKMDAENQLFLHRVGQLPLVKAASQTAISIYERAKKSNRLFNTTLQMAEDTVKYASQVKVVKMVLDSRLIGVANKIAVSGLDKVENNYPIVKKTPTELWSAGTDYYQHSRLKAGVDKVYSAKDYGVAKISGIKKYYYDLISDAAKRVLDFSESTVDKYVTMQAEANGHQEHCVSTLPNIDRIRCISGKFYHGIKYRAGLKYDATKQYALQTIGTFQSTTLLFDHAKNSASWLNEKTQTGLATVQERAKMVWQDIQHRAEPITVRSEGIVLALVQGSANNVAFLSQQIVKYSSPYLPEGMEKTAAAGAAYIVELRDTFAKAKTLGELRDQVTVEIKQTFSYAQGRLTKAINYLAEFPPVNWIAPPRNPIATQVVHTSEEHVHETIQNGYIGDDHHDEHY